MKGRHAKSAEERKLSGNAGKRGAPEKAAVEQIDTAPPVTKYDAPADLPDFAKLKWREFMPLLLEMGMLRDTDRESLRMLCIECWKYDSAKKNVEQNGIIYETDSKHGKMLRQSPAVAIMDRSARTIKQLLESLGMTSAGRRKMLAMTKQLDLPFGNEPTPPAATKPTEGQDPDDPTGFISRTVN